LPAVGNDIVDLNSAGSHGKFRDARFLKRVFTPAERQAIQAAENPDLVLWSFWAAKESAYKILSKLRSPPPLFAHRRFSCVWEAEHSEHTGSIKQLCVCCPPEQTQPGHDSAALRVEIRVETDAHCVHAYGAPQGWEKSSAYWMLVGKQRLGQAPDARVALAGFSDAERSSIKSIQSAEVRIAAKTALARRMSMEVGRLQIIRPTRDKKPQPPFLLVDGKPAGMDISLSHHGGWVAWCCSGVVS